MIISQLNQSQKFKTSSFVRGGLFIFACCVGVFLSSCAPMNVPKGRTVDIPPPTKAVPRPDAINDGRESVLTIPLGVDVLVPELGLGDELPKEIVGPYELRGETLAGALQLVLAGFDVPIAFQADSGLTKKITVTGLKGELDSVVRRLCGLADLYCTYEGGILEVKETETFTVSLPPLDDGGFESISTGLAAVSGAETVIDESTRTLIYTVTQRNSDRARRYFDRLRANTALIVYEIYIWEVQLDNANSTGIKWEKLQNISSFNTGITLNGGISNQVGTPITIGLPTKEAVSLTDGSIFKFISEQGAVKTISQPQLSVLSGSKASLKVLETRNYIESLTRSTDADGDETVSTTTAQVDSGFTLSIDSSWDQSTVYASIDLDIDEFIQFDDFDAGNNDTLSLPRTSQRELKTQVRTRPGDSILIAGLVRERDEYDASGIGFNTPSIPTGRTGLTTNTELVILMRPRIVRYVSQDELLRENRKKLLPSKNEFTLDPSGKKKKFDIDMLLNPDMTIAPMEES